MNAITPTVCRLELTDSDFATIRSETARLPWRWRVTSRCFGEGTPCDPMTTMADVEPAEGDDVPFWLPGFSIRPTQQGYSVTAYERLPCEVVADTLETIDVELDVCATITEAIEIAEDWLLSKLSDWGLQVATQSAPKAA